MKHRGICLGLLILATPLVALAGEPRLLATFGKWDAYIYLDNGHKVCYMASKANQPLHSDEELEKKPPAPKVVDMDKNRRGDPYAVLTERPADHQKNIFSYMAGYTYKPGSKTTVSIDGQDFTLFTKGDTAWSPDDATDSKIAKAMQSGKIMTVDGVSAKGQKTTDKLFLDGASGAYDKITKECD